MKFGFTITDFTEITPDLGILAIKLNFKIKDRSIKIEEMIKFIAKELIAQGGLISVKVITNLGIAEVDNDKLEWKNE